METSPEPDRGLVGPSVEQILGWKSTLELERLFSKRCSRPVKLEHRRTKHLSETGPDAWLLIGT